MLNVGRTRVLVSPDSYRDFDYLAMLVGLQARCHRREKREWFSWRFWQCGDHMRR